MKAILTTLTILLLLSCKHNSQESLAPQPPAIQKSPLDPDSADSLYFTETEIRELQVKSQSLKKEGLLAIEDDIPSLQEIVQSRKVFKEADEYILDYTYPYLNEDVNPAYKNFNDYMNESYLNIERTVNQIVEDKELLCDTLQIQRFRDRRMIDFKLHSTKNSLISILLYKESYYSGMLHSTYMFDCLNYDVKKQEFIYFDDFFLEGSQKMVFDLINQTIYDEIHSGEMYYDCWEISDSDFRAYKNNFVVNGTNIEFYFDDCIICPSYTGQYSVVIPVPDIMHLIKGYQRPLLL